MNSNIQAERGHNICVILQELGIERFEIFEKKIH